MIEGKMGERNITWMIEWVHGVLMDYYGNEWMINE